MQYAQKTAPVFVYNAESYEIHKNPLQSVKMCAILYTVDEMSDSTDGSAVNVQALTADSEDGASEHWNAQ